MCRTIQRILCAIFIASASTVGMGCSSHPNLTISLADSMKEGGQFRPVTVHLIGLTQAQHDQWISTTASVDEYFKIGGESEQPMKNKTVLALNAKNPAFKISKDDVGFWGPWKPFDPKNGLRYLFILADLRPAPPGTSGGYEPRRQVLDMSEGKWKDASEIAVMIDRRTGVGVSAK